VTSAWSPSRTTSGKSFVGAGGSHGAPHRWLGRWRLDHQRRRHGGGHDRRRRRGEHLRQSHHRRRQTLRIVIGGSLIGVDSASGLISGNEIGTLKIGNDDRRLRRYVWRHLSDLGIASISIDGSVLGATRFSLFAATSFIQSGGDIGSIKIGDVPAASATAPASSDLGQTRQREHWRLVGGGNGGGGFIFVNGDIGSVAVGGSLLGGMARTAVSFPAPRATSALVKTR
jgi:hypothetical protein